MSSTPTCFCSKNDLFNEDFIWKYWLCWILFWGRLWAWDSGTGICFLALPVSLCNLGKLLSKNLFCQLSREHYNPNLPGLLQGLHETMNVKHLVCDWHTTGVQYVKTTIIIIHSLPTLMLPWSTFSCFHNAKGNARVIHSPLCANIRYKYIYKYKPLSVLSCLLLSFLFLATKLSLFLLITTCVIG